MITLGGQTIGLGQSKVIDLEVGKLYDGTMLSIPVEVRRGKTEGPTLFVSAAIHGDEINGIEIVRRLLRKRKLKQLCGTLLAIPIVNVYGFNTKSRYLPDRRDLNRCFPGNPSGSLAARIAHKFMEEIVSISDVGVDLHTAAVFRVNIPQIRANLENEDTAALAKAFGAPISLHSKLRDGSLRESADEVGAKVLLYEAGEALRFDEMSIKVGVNGIVSVMEKIGMLPAKSGAKNVSEPLRAKKSNWIRAPRSGILRLRVKLGKTVTAGETLGVLSDPLGLREQKVTATKDGVIIGCTTIPLVNQGDALFHIATFSEDDMIEDIGLLDSDQFQMHY